jgi:hypothetical protein
MIAVQFPEHNYKIKEEQGKQFIFDEFRKQWLVLIPEEWVRQNFLQYLVQTKSYPASLIAIEKVIQVGELKKRCDIVVYKQSTPWMIVECKEMNVPLTEAVIKQILNYNITLRVSFLVITNGNNTYAIKIDGRHTEWLSSIPDYS